MVKAYIDSGTGCADIPLLEVNKIYWHKTWFGDSVTCCVVSVILENQCHLLFTLTFFRVSGVWSPGHQGSLEITSRFGSWCHQVRVLINGPG